MTRLFDWLWDSRTLGMFARRAVIVGALVIGAGTLVIGVPYATIVYLIFR